MGSCCSLAIWEIGKEEWEELNIKNTMFTKRETRTEGERKNDHEGNSEDADEDERETKPGLEKNSTRMVDTGQMVKTRLVHMLPS